MLMSRKAFTSYCYGKNARFLSGSDLAPPEGGDHQRLMDVTPILTYSELLTKNLSTLIHDLREFLGFRGGVGFTSCPFVYSLIDLGSTII
jgi:hypothetical protein